jgi:hypothetical protein
VLELRDLKLELFELRARNQAELLEEAFQAGAGSLAQAHGFASPAMRGLLDQLARLVSAHSARACKVVRQRVRALCGQRNGAERGRPTFSSASARFLLFSTY